MRPYVVFVLLLGMVVGWAAHLIWRPVLAATGAPPLEPGAASQAERLHEASPGSPNRPQEGTELLPRPTERAVKAPPPTPPTSTLSRPLRVVALSWHQALPGIWANQGLEPHDESPFAAGQLEVTIEVQQDPNEVARRLALGGDQPGGADVALMALPTFVALYETLAPLSPKIFLTTGWSRGHFGLFSPVREGLTQVRGSTGTLRARPGSPEHFFALYIFQLLGVSAQTVQVSAPVTQEAPRDPPQDAGEPPGQDAEARTVRPTATAAEVVPRPVGVPDPRGARLASTADMPRLIPFVALSGEHVLREHHAALLRFARTWLAAGQAVSQHVPQAARLGASQPEGPDSLRLLGSLGQVGPSSLRDNARVSGLAGREVATLERLFALTWALFQEAGEVNPPAPMAPLAQLFLAELVRPVAGQEAGPADLLVDHPELWTRSDLARGQLRPVFDVALGQERSDNQMMEEAALLGRLWRGALAVASHDEGPRWKQALEAAERRYDLPLLRVLEQSSPEAPILQLMAAR